MKRVKVVSKRSIKVLFHYHQSPNSTRVVCLIAWCLFLSFFEWDRKDRGRKQPHFIYFADSSPTKEMVELSTSEASEREGVFIVCWLVFAPDSPFQSRHKLMAAFNSLPFAEDATSAVCLQHKWALIKRHHLPLLPGYAHFTPLR